MFIQFGMLTDEKFYEKATSFALYKNLNGDYATLDEYMDKVRESQVDKDGNMVLLYTNDPDAHYTYIERAKAKGYDVLLMDGELDVHCMSRHHREPDSQRGHGSGFLHRRAERGSAQGFRSPAAVCGRQTAV